MKISVVITILNEEKSIEKLLSSLDSQALKPDEIIIVDGVSKDKTKFLISNFKFLNKDDKKRLKFFEKAGNRSVGRNFGIMKAKNEIIVVTDGGCYPKKDWLQKIVAPFADKQTQVVSGYYEANAKTSFQKAVAPYFLVMPDKLFSGMEFLPSSRSVAFRKSVWEKVGGYPEQFSHNEDLVFDYAIKDAGYKFLFEPKAVVYWNPPDTLKKAFKTFYRFALGDAESNIPRPKVKFIFYRYCMFLVSLFVIWNLSFGFIILYFVWSVQKNFRYAKMVQAIFWLPVIQITSDLAIMMGTLQGKLKR